MLDEGFPSGSPLTSGKAKTVDDIIRTALVPLVILAGIATAVITTISKGQEFIFLFLERPILTGALVTIALMLIIWPAIGLYQESIGAQRAAKARRIAISCIAFIYASYAFWHFQTQIPEKFVLSQVDVELAREARLLAEIEGSESITFPKHLEERQNEESVALLFSAERRILNVSMHERDSEKAQLREQIKHSFDEINGITTMREATNRQIELIDQELAVVRNLWQQNLVQFTRVSSLERDLARLIGERGHLETEIARVRGKITGLELQLVGIDQQLRGQRILEMTQTQRRIADLRSACPSVTRQR